ncbi:MAG: hypothetical protein ACI4PT_09150, partial [Candidatus Avoscillospira sp.]
PHPSRLRRDTFPSRGRLLRRFRASASHRQIPICLSVFPAIFPRAPHPSFTERSNQKTQIQYKQQMQYHVVKVRDQSCITGGKNSHCVPEAFVISFQFLLGCAPNRVKPMAKELNKYPEGQDGQKEPLPNRAVNLIQKDSHCIKNEHTEFRAFQPNTVHQGPFLGFIRYNASEEPYP